MKSYERCFRTSYELYVVYLLHGVRWCSFWVHLKDLFVMYMSGTWSEKIWTAGFPWISLQSGKSLKLNSFRVARLLTGWLRAPSVLKERESVLWTSIIIQDLHSCNNTASLLPHSIGHSSCKGSPMFKEKEHRPYLLTGAQFYIMKSHVGWDLHWWSSLKNTICQTKLSQNDFLAENKKWNVGMENT